MSEFREVPSIGVSGEVFVGLEKGEDARTRATVVGAGGSGRKMWVLGQKLRITGRSRCQTERVPVTPPSHFIKIKPVAQEHGA